MKQISIILALAVLPFWTFGQSIEDRLEDLEEKYMKLRREINIEDSIDFVTTQYRIIGALDRAPKLKFDFDLIVSNMKRDQLNTKLLNAYNPGSDVFGVSFMEVVLIAAEANFISSLDAEDGMRFKDIIQKVLKFPGAALMTANPVIGIVSSIANIAAHFAKTKLSGKAKDMVVETKNVFDQEKIDKFTKDLKPYVEFYGDMTITNTKFSLGLDRLQAKNKGLTESVNDYNTALLTALVIDAKAPVPVSTQANNIFKTKKDEYGFKNFKTVLTDTRILQGDIQAEQLEIYEVQVKAFKDEYNSLLNTYLVENIQLLEKAKKVTVAQGYDPTKVDVLMSEIRAFIGVNMHDVNIDKATFGIAGKGQKEFDAFR